MLPECPPSMRPQGERVRCRRAVVIEGALSDAHGLNHPLVASPTELRRRKLSLLSQQSTTKPSRLTFVTSPISVEIEEIENLDEFSFSLDIAPPESPQANQPEEPQSLLLEITKEPGA
eukprot:TRINITY_DN22551_c0_g1_i1.p1 TRINITY_DN22551_c0_g1~~TRINITY_DN22551_c0_g1_i1.p1  ORF type:complete len:136 (+),score=21.01 TRINITY_DN22551_c0_g1_i1:56-409(+)